MQWDSRFAHRTKTMKRSTIREILKLTSQPDVISFAGGLPAAEHFPVERVKQATDTVLSERGSEALQYSTTEGMPELRQLVAARLSNPNFSVPMENVVIVSGSQQALDLIGRTLINEGDRIVVENPTYLGMLMCWKPYHVEFLPVPTDDQGMIIDELPAQLEKQPHLMYIMPNFQNPQGTTLSYERRIDLIKQVEKAQIPLVEDNAYSELRYSGASSPSLLAMDAENLGNSGVDGHVIYVGTFSKILTPGLRVAWVAAPTPIIEKIVQAKQATDLHTGTLAQFITYEVARDGFLDEHINRLCDVYRERRDVMLASMERYFPEGVTWTKPEGGLFLMARLPEGVDAAVILEQSVQHQVAFIPGIDFFSGGIGANTMRLNFSAMPPDLIEEGIKRLGNLLKEALTLA